MADDEKQLTSKEAARAFGWPLIIFGSLVLSGPGVLAILQEIFVDYQLVPLFQRVLDTWNQILAILAGPIEPPVKAFLSWINGLFGWNLTLGEHWRPLFMLGMVYVGATLRNALRKRDWSLLRWNIALGLGFLALALAAGLAPLSGGESLWWSQALTQGAALGLMLGVFVLVLGVVIGEGLGGSLRASAFLFVIGFAPTVLIALVPGTVGDGSALLVLSALILLLGGWALRNGLKNQDNDDVFVGLAMLGGFAVAGVVMLADLGLKLLA